MGQYKLYSVFVDLNDNDDYMEIPIIHSHVEAKNKSQAIEIILANLARNKVLNYREVKVTAVLLSTWATMKI